MLDMVDTASSYGRALIICQFLQESFKVKESSLHEIWNVKYCVFYLMVEQFWNVVYHMCIVW